MSQELADRFTFLNEIETAEATLEEAERAGDDKAMWEARVVLAKANIALEENTILNAERHLKSLR